MHRQLTEPACQMRSQRFKSSVENGIHLRRRVVEFTYFIRRAGSFSSETIKKSLKDIKSIKSQAGERIMALTVTSRIDVVGKLGNSNLESRLDCGHNLLVALR